MQYEWNILVRHLGLFVFVWCCSEIWSSRVERVSKKQKRLIKIKNLTFMVHFSVSQNVCLDQKINSSRGFDLNAKFLRRSRKCGNMRNDPSEKHCSCFSVIGLISVKSCWDFRLSSYPHRFQRHPNHSCCLLPSLYFFPKINRLTCDVLKMLMICLFSS